MKIILFIAILISSIFIHASESEKLKSHSTLIFELKGLDQMQRYQESKKIFFKNDDAYLMLYNNYLRQISTYKENVDEPLNVFQINNLDKIAETPFGTVTMCNFVGLDSILLSSEKYIAFIENGNVKWLKDNESLLGKGNCFIKNSATDAQIDFIDGKLLVFYGGEFNAKNKRYPADFSMLALVDLNNGEVNKLPFKNPDFFDYAIKLQEISAVTHHDRIYLRYGFDSAIYALEKDNTVSVIKLDDESTQVITTSSALPDSYAFKKSRNIFCDFIPTKSGFYNLIRKSEAKLSGHSAIYLNLYDANFKKLKSIKLRQNENYYCPPVTMLTNCFVMQLNENTNSKYLFFHVYKLD